LSELDTEEGVEADSVTEGEEKEEEEEDECSEDSGSDELTVSCNDKVHSIIVVAP
jgi:hypothetical protein